MTETIDRKTYTDAELPAVRIVDGPKGQALFDLFCREKHGTPDTWSVGEINSDPDLMPAGFVRLKGGYRTAKGKWKGRDKSGDRTIFALMADVNAFSVAYWTARGVCACCYGEGRRWAKISRNPDDNRFRKCEKCNGTGIPEVRE
jgi:hypothetical protein